MVSSPVELEVITVATNPDQREGNLYPVRLLAAEADLLILLGPPALGDGLSPPARIRAPGEDPATLKEVFRRAFALNYRGSSS